MAPEAPWLWLIAGPNGAGKTTLAKRVLIEDMAVDQFVNADEIARGLSPFRPETVAVRAGRLMLERIDDLVVSRTSFAIETTLASRRYLQLVNSLRSCGWRVGIVFVWLDSPERAIERVSRRVADGGHNVPEGDIRRRYRRGLENLPSFLDIAD